MDAFIALMMEDFIVLSSRSVVDYFMGQQMRLMQHLALPMSESHAAQSNSACPASPRLNSAGKDGFISHSIHYRKACMVEHEPYYQRVSMCARIASSTNSSSAIARRLDFGRVPKRGVYSRPGLLVVAVSV